jgi:DNA-binding NtrC family response regulator
LPAPRVAAWALPGHAGGVPPHRACGAHRRPACSDRRERFRQGAGGAQSIHERSARSGNPFIAINCGAIPAGLIEAELFGYEKGSFTGAARAHAGVFERAEGGTLLLDEVTEMPLDMQTRLLRVLETKILPRRREYRVQLDVRLIAATNRCPLQAVQSGQLREDLLYRLAVFPIEMPPLRDRGDDVELLAEHFLAELNAHRPDAKAAVGTGQHDAEAAFLAGQCPRTEELHRTGLHSGRQTSNWRR